MTYTLHTCYSRVVLQTFLLRSLLIPALVLRHLDLPVPGGWCPGVDVQCDGDAGRTGGNVHVLARVVAADDGRRRHPGHRHWNRTSKPNDIELRQRDPKQSKSFTSLLSLVFIDIIVSTLEGNTRQRHNLKPEILPHLQSTCKCVRQTVS